MNEDVSGLLAEATRLLASEFQPEQVWLFGSYAWGEPRSDSDLLVVVPESDEAPIRRMQRARLCLQNLDISKDILVETRAEFERFRHVRASLSYKIANEGRLLYGRR